MERKIILNLFYMGLISALLGVFLTGFIFHRSFSEGVWQNLETESKIISAAYTDIDLPKDLKKFSNKTLRITLIAADGSVLYDSNANSSTMENHLQRPEVQSALKSGKGSATRTSDTLGTKDYYYAVLNNDGTVLRISSSAETLFSLFQRAIPALFLALIIMLIIAVVFSLYLTKKLLSPIKAIPAKLDDPKLAENPKLYPELVPIIKEIQSQRNMQEEMRQEFTANVSHELKTPLTSISGYAEIIETGMAEGDDARKFAGKIHKEAKRCSTLISDIIKLSLLDSEESEKLTDKIDLNKTVAECTEQLKDPAAKHNIHIKVEGTAEPFAGNSTEIYELVFNIMDNAIKYNRENGGVLVKLDGKKFSVEDTGIGISDEDKKRIFERFYRADKSRSRARGGTGLGLSIVKHIAEHHNAKITVESELNIGTKITVDFEKSF